MEDAKRQTLARIVRAGAEEMLPRQLALLEQICAIDSGTGNEAEIGRASCRERV